MCQKSIYGMMATLFLKLFLSKWGKGYMGIIYNHDGNT